MKSNWKVNIMRLQIVTYSVFVIVLVVGIAYPFDLRDSQLVSTIIVPPILLVPISTLVVCGCSQKIQAERKTLLSLTVVSVVV